MPGFLCQHSTKELVDCFLSVLAKPGFMCGRDRDVGKETIFLIMGKRLVYIDRPVHSCVCLPIPLLYICVKHPLCAKQC